MYEISLPEEGGFALVKWRGAATPAEIERSGVEVIDLAAKEGLSRVLVDVVDISNRLSVTDLFLSTVAHSRLGPPRPRAALLGRTDQQRELNLIETVAFNRGMPIKAFTDADDAMAWLMK